MGPIQSSINTTIGMIAGLKKLGDVGESAKGLREDFNKKAQAILAENKKNTEEAIAEYNKEKGFGTSPTEEEKQKLLQQTRENPELQKQFAALAQSPQIQQMLGGYSSEKGQTALTALGEKQQGMTAQQEAAAAYRQAIREREEQNRVTTYKFNPETNETNKITEVKK